MQIIIDSSKRMYEVDAIAEIDRIKKSPIMKREKDFPEFMRYTRPIEVVRGGKELPYEEIAMQKNAIKKRIDRTLTCPMNHLQEWLDKIQGASKDNTIPISDFMVRLSGKPRYEQMTKIMEIITEFEDYTRRFSSRFDDYDAIDEYFQEYDHFIEKIQRVKIGNPVTINKMVLSALSVDGTWSEARGQMAAHTIKVLSCLYRTNPEKFLMSFVKKSGKFASSKCQ